jgi:hypothetical protein
MSLKGAHILFIAVCVLVALGFGVWGVRDYRESGPASSLYLGLASFAAAVMLGLYGAWFLRKLKKISYV